MGPILQFIRPFDMFDSDTLAIVSTAYDRALISLNDSGQPPIVREVIAARMLDLAARGERDIGRLCQGALVHVGG